MKTKIELGSSPFCEECVQVGTDNYYELARKECRAYINQLWRILMVETKKPKEKLQELVSFSIVSNGHDYGDYFEVVIRFDYENEEAAELGYFLDGKCPELWDQEAKKELGI